MNQTTPSAPTMVGSTPSFEQLELEEFEESCRDGRERFSSRLSALDARLEVPRGWRSRGMRQRSVVTRMGTVRVSRRRFLDEHGRCRYPLDEHLGLEAARRISPAIERRVVSLSASVSFREAVSIVSELTAAHLSHATAHAALRRAGERIASEQRARAGQLHDLGIDPGGGRAADPLLAEADGTVVAWQGERVRRGEVRLAVFSGGRAGGKCVSYASVEDARSFWRAASSECASAFDITAIKGCVVSGDGAGWVRGGLDVLPGARFLLDPFHVTLALRDATGSHPAASRLSALLYSRGLPAVEEVLGELASRQPERSEAIRGVLRYLRANADGLWRSDPHLGTIEGHIDKTLANRMKKRGRRWSMSGADAMARVVAAKRSGRPLPIGCWIPPMPAVGTRPKAPAVTSGTVEPTPGRARQARIVSNARGAGFTPKLRDIADSGYAHWNVS